MQITIDEMKKKFESLPEDLKWAIVGAKIDEQVAMIGSSQGLNVRQLGQLSLEVHAVMLGYIHPDKFAESIKESLGLSNDKIEVLVKNINEKIFWGIKERLAEVRGIRLEKYEEKSTNLPQVKISNQDNAEIGVDPLERKIETEDKKITYNVINKKLASAVKSNMVKTTHSLENMSPSNIPIKPKKEDPYREPI